MSMLDKLKFWKKDDDDFDFDKGFGGPTGLPGDKTTPGGLPGEGFEKKDEFGLGPQPGPPGALGSNFLEDNSILAPYYSKDTPCTYVKLFTNLLRNHNLSSR